MLQRKELMELLGWTGAGASLAAFGLNSMNVIGSQSLPYLALNVLGCSLLILYALSKKAPASWVLNSIWLLITLVALLKNTGG